MHKHTMLHMLISNDCTQAARSLHTSSSRKPFEPDMREYIEFFVGDFTAYKNQYDHLWEFRSVNANHRFLRTWYDTAWRTAMRCQIWDADNPPEMGDPSQGHHVAKTIKCRAGSRGKNYTYTFNIGFVLKLVLGKLSASDTSTHWIEASKSPT
jgi:hypothetical protein